MSLLVKDFLIGVLLLTCAFILAGILAASFVVGCMYIILQINEWYRYRKLKRSILRAARHHAEQVAKQGEK